MNRDEKIAAVAKIVSATMEKLEYNLDALDDRYAFAIAIVDAIGVDEEKIYSILYSLCDSDSQEAIMYSEAQAIEIATNPEVIRIKEPTDD